MIEAITVILTSAVFPFLIFLINKLYYLNHKVTKIEVMLNEVIERLERIEKYLYN